MCGIVGFIGREPAAPILLDGLSRLEYRGYDSAGLAVYDRERGLQVVKAKGRLQVLRDLTEDGARWLRNRPCVPPPRQPCPSARRGEAPVSGP